jgi:metal-dependent amidase/aminoacylase/carboxypeptidase family protein
MDTWPKKRSGVTEVTERMNNVAKGAALMAGVTYEIKLIMACTNYWPMKLEQRQPTVKAITASGQLRRKLGGM